MKKEDNNFKLTALEEVRQLVKSINKIDQQHSHFIRISNGILHIDEVYVCMENARYAYPLARTVKLNLSKINIADIKTQSEQDKFKTSIKGFKDNIAYVSDVFAGCQRVLDKYDDTKVKC